MTLGNKISKLRKENNLTQEQLAETLGVSRQAISKWENDVTYPETDKLIRMSELFGCSLDYLINDVQKTENEQKENNFVFLKKVFRERKSKKMLWGMPLFHFGKNAHGVVAIGLKARGVLSIGVLSKGILSFGFLSMGIFSFGLASLGLMAFGTAALGILAFGCFCAGIFSAGAISLGIFSFGAICVGVISAGAVSVGDFSAGALAIGKYIAVGDSARAMIAIGETEAQGTLFEKIGNVSTQDIETITALLDANVPAYLAWAKKVFIMLLG